MISYWHHKAVCLSVCHSVCLWRWTLWLNEISYCKYLNKWKGSGSLGTRRYNCQPLTPTLSPQTPHPKNFQRSAIGYLSNNWCRCMMLCFGDIGCTKAVAIATKSGTCTVWQKDTMWISIDCYRDGCRRNNSDSFMLDCVTMPSLLLLHTRTWNSLPQHITSALSRLSSSGIHSHGLYRNVCSACAV